MAKCPSERATGERFQDVSVRHPEFEKINLNFWRGDQYLANMRKPTRQDAYRSLSEAVSAADVARELGVATEFILQEIARRRMRAVADGKVRGVELAAYLDAAKRPATTLGNRVRRRRLR